MKDVLHDGCAKCGGTGQEILKSTLSRDGKGKLLSLALCDQCWSAEQELKK